MKSGVKEAPFWILIVLTGLLITGCGGGEDQTPSTETAEESTSTPQDVTVQVDFDGEAPRRERIDASGNKECGTDTILGESVLVNDNGTLRNVVVQITAEQTDLQPVEDGERVVDQEGCRYRPHVMAIQAGQTFTISHSDSGMHNVRALSPEDKQLFNEVTFQGDKLEKSFDTPGVFSLECNVHPWMMGWVYVLDQGLARVTGSTGEVTFADLPPGSYELSLWHEEYGTLSRSVTVQGDEPLHVSFTYSS